MSPRVGPSEGPPPSAAPVQEGPALGRADHAAVAEGRGGPRVRAAGAERVPGVPVQPQHQGRRHGGVPRAALLRAAPLHQHPPGLQDRRLQHVHVHELQLVLRSVGHG
jgi:hypothetical protein